MKFNFVTHKHRYIESGQRNPIRYTLVHQIDDGVFENTTNAFKCRDYFNDFVMYKKLGFVFSVYGMSSDLAKFDANGGLYVYLTGLFPEFEENIKNVITPTFTKEWGTRLIFTKDSDNTGLLWMSPECFESTFRISALTLFLRNCNVNHVIPTYEHIFTQSFANDGHFTRPKFEFFLNKKWTFPLQSNYVWYQDNTYNSKGKPGSSGIYHDNGVMAWLHSSTPVSLDYVHYAWISSLPVSISQLPDAVYDNYVDENVEDEEEEFS